MKPREERRPVLIKARMFAGDSWRDVNILNISSRGLLIRASVVPLRGTYLEVRKGSQSAVAKVVWSDDCRFGVLTQDRLNIDAFIRQPDSSGVEDRHPLGSPPVERRRNASRETADQRHQRNRALARAVEFASIGLLAATAALSGYGLIEHALARPFAAATAVLEREPPRDQ